MKKNLLFILAISGFSMSSFGQCTPNPSYASAPYGFYPDGTTFLTTGSAQAGVAYDAVIDFKSFVDTSVSVPPLTVQVKLDAFRINSVSGLPAGFTVTEGGTSFNTGLGIWENVYGTPGNTATLSPVQGCISLNANMASVTAAAPVSGYTDYPLVFQVDGRIGSTNPDATGFGVPNGSWMSDHGNFGVTTIPIEDYAIRVHAAMTVGIVNVNDEDAVRIYPNPSNGVFHLALNNLGQNASAVVYDVQGKGVWSRNFTSTSGLETIDLSRFESGIYAISIMNGAEVTVKKLIVQ